MHIRISSAVEGFRRAGMRHSRTPKTYPVDRFTEEQLEQLKAEPRLAVSFIDDEEAAAEAAQATDPKGTLESGRLDGVVDGDGTQKDLAELKVDELRALAKDLEVEGYADMKKADLVAAIKAVEVQVPTAGEA